MDTQWMYCIIYYVCIHIYISRYIHIHVYTYIYIYMYICVLDTLLLYLCWLLLSLWWLWLLLPYIFRYVTFWFWSLWSKNFKRIAPCSSRYLVRREFVWNVDLDSRCHSAGVAAVRLWPEFRRGWGVHMRKMANNPRKDDLEMVGQLQIYVSFW